MTGPAHRAPIAIRQELYRKAIHLASAVFPLAYAWVFPRPVIATALLVSTFVAIAVEFARRRHTPSRLLYERLVGGMLREHERERLVGATWMLVSYTFVVLVTPAAVAIAAMCAVSLGDAAAALVGRTIGRVRIFSGKTLEGSIACLITAALAARWIAGLALPGALLVGLVALLSELPDGPGDDNARVALLTAAAGMAALWLFGMAGPTVP
jgi:dolichol kinase